MKRLIKKILKEEEGNKVIKNYVTKMWKKQVDSGLIPHIPYEDLQKRKLTQRIESIDKWYFEFFIMEYLMVLKKPKLYFITRLRILLKRI